MPAKEVPVPSGESVGRRPSRWAREGGGGRRARRARCWCRALSVLAAVVIVAAAATARLFVWPDRGMPAKVSAIVSLDRPGGTLSAALRLAAQHRAQYLVISLGTPESGYGCPRPIARVKLICFNPAPATTQGEAQFVGRLARKYHWDSVAVVTITPQDSRARLRVERCFAGPVYVVTTPISLVSWPYQIAYEWGALAKALLLQRACGQAAASTTTPRVPAGLCIRRAFRVLFIYMTYGKGGPSRPEIWR